MKPLYCLEFALSEDKNGTIPAKKLEWFIPNSKKIAYEDRKLAERLRLELQPDLNNWIIRVSRVSLIKNIWIRMHSGPGDKWIFIER